MSVRDTFFLRNVASRSGGAVDINGGIDITINNITCAGNRIVEFGGCLNINSVTLTLSNSDISENVGQYGGGVRGVGSRIQVFLLTLTKNTLNLHLCHGKSGIMLSLLLWKCVYLFENYFL